MTKISATSLQWLAAHAIVGHEADLETTYAFKHEYNARREITEQVTPNQSLRWRVDICATDGARVVESPIVRQIFPSSALWSPGRSTGVVVYNHAFILVEAFRHAGVGRALYDAEDRLYRRWTVREVHLQAQQDGLVVWPKLGFTTTPDRLALLRQEYTSWARRAKSAPPAVWPDALDEFPAEFLRSRGQLDMFKVLA